jgi:hypothetical protein
MTIFVKRKPYQGFVELFYGSVIDPLMSCSRRGEKKMITQKSLVINCEIPIDMIYQCIVEVIVQNLRKIRNQVFLEKLGFFILYIFP